MKRVYDLLIIGAGVSGAVLASSLVNKGFKGKIGIIENGRNFGGRCSSRISLKNTGWTLNHGSPNFNIQSNPNKLLSKFLNELLKKDLIFLDDSEVIEINNNLETSHNQNNIFYQGKVYRARSTMSLLLEELVNEGIKFNKIELFFKTLVKNFNFKNNKWFISSDDLEFEANFLISSSNLILHKRSMQILKKDKIPIREAIPEGENRKVDKIINFLNKQESIERKNYLIYPNKLYKYKKINLKNDIHFLFDNKAENKFGFERIIFQKQASQNIGIVIHTKNLNLKRLSEDNITSDKLIDKFNYIFKNSNLINVINDYGDISIMKWRSSQPKGLGIPKQFQICEKNKLAFCGDWFDFSGFGRVEGAIQSALYLSSKVMKYL